MGNRHRHTDPSIDNGIQHHGDAGKQRLCNGWGRKKSGQRQEAGFNC